MEKEKIRNSNFELLRIFAMFLIIIHHYSVHAGWDMFTFENFSVNIILTQFMRYGGKIGCHLFMLITGYFMIKKQINFKKIFYLALEMEFYSVTIFLIFRFIRGESYGISDWIRYFKPVVFGNWFVVNYIMLYFFIPFINKFLNSLEKPDFKKLLIVTIFIYSIVPSIWYYFGKGEWQFSNFDFLLVSYMIGAYISLYGINKFESKKYCFKILFISVLIILLLIGLFDFLAIKLKQNKYIEMATITRFETSIFVILISITLFYLFKNKDIKSRLINFVASSTLGIYLIHDNFILRGWIWKEVYPNNNYLYSNYMIVHFIIKVIAVFIICLVIDKLRLYLIEKPLKKPLDKLYEKVESLSKKVYEKVEKLI